MLPALRYLAPEALAERLAARAPGLVVVDVRDADFVGGHIRGAVHLASADWDEEDAIDALVARVRGEKLVVVHCMYSQQRGPACAARLQALMSSLEEGEAADGSEASTTPEVMVLRGGWRGFSSAFGSDAALVAPDAEATNLWP